MLKRVLSICAIMGLLMTMMAFTGCNTIRGLGKDVQQGGQAIEKAAH